MRENFRKYFIFAVIFCFVFSLRGAVFAKTDLSISAADISFSKEEPLEGEKIRIFGRVFNLGDTDVYGFVVFSDGKKQIGEPQPISVRADTYDDVFIDWHALKGSHNIRAKITIANAADDNSENNSAAKENYFVDSDTDRDGAGDIKDIDDDNDGLSDEKETALGTDPLKQDTDGDKALDGVDAFPLDPAEWQDTDSDSLGNIKDADDDNDGIQDDQELFVLGTNPLSPDSDSDGLNDKEELDIGSNPLVRDTDGDGIIDSEDSFPLDSQKGQASIIEAFKGMVEEKKLPFSPAKGAVLAGGLILALFLLRKIIKIF